MPDAVAPSPVRPRLATVNWSCMAEPRPDGYDTDVVLALSGVGAGAGADATPDGGPVWFDVGPIYAGRSDFEHDFAGYRTAGAGHPNLAGAVDLVGAWPEGDAQARRLIRVVHAGLDPSVGGDATVHADMGGDVGGEAIVTASHSYEDAFGTMWATVHSSLGLAEAIVHEMAHHKLRASGVWFTRARNLVANPPDELYPSPLLGGRLRPMPAVLHAHYALLHMLALKVAVIARDRERDRDGSVVALARAQLVRDLRMVRQGAATLRRALVVDQAGSQFMPALWDWQQRLIAAAAWA